MVLFVIPYLSLIIGVVRVQADLENKASLIFGFAQYFIEIWSIRSINLFYTCVCVVSGSLR